MTIDWLAFAHLLRRPAILVLWLAACLVATPVVAEEPSVDFTRANEAAALSHIAFKLFEMKQFSECAATYRRAYEINPAETGYLYSAARCTHEAGRLEAAKDAFDEYLRTAPEGEHAAKIRDKLVVIERQRAETARAETPTAEVPAQPEIELVPERIQVGPLRTPEDQRIARERARRAMQLAENRLQAILVARQEYEAEVARLAVVRSQSDAQYEAATKSMATVQQELAEMDDRMRSADVRHRRHLQEERHRKEAELKRLAAERDAAAKARDELLAEHKTKQGELAAVRAQERQTKEAALKWQQVERMASGQAAATANVGVQSGARAPGSRGLGWGFVAGGIASSLAGAVSYALGASQRSDLEAKFNQKCVTFDGQFLICGIDAASARHEQDAIDFKKTLGSGGMILGAAGLLVGSVLVATSDNAEVAVTPTPQGVLLTVRR